MASGAWYHRAWVLGPSRSSQSALEATLAFRASLRWIFSVSPRTWIPLKASSRVQNTGNIYIYIIQCPMSSLNKALLSIILTVPHPSSKSLGLHPWGHLPSSWAHLASFLVGISGPRIEAKKAVGLHRKLATKRVGHAAACPKERMVMLFLGDLAEEAAKTCQVAKVGFRCSTCQRSDSTAQISSG